MSLIFIENYFSRWIYYSNDRTPRDLDFVLLTDNSNIEEFIKEYHYLIKKWFDGYKLNKHNIKIDIWSTNDVYKAIEYNLYIPFGFIDGIERNQLIKINPQNQGNKK